MSVFVEIGFYCDGLNEDGDKSPDCHILKEPILSDTKEYAWKIAAQSYGWHRRPVKSGSRSRSGSHHYCPECWKLARKRNANT